ncbi:MAG: hypothetical protein Q7Q73_19295 [Verrucomicrobiota bacterium JB024]|nr:hypothetical protein [Verrucomicrobiota bacterium JB024]
MTHKMNTLVLTLLLGSALTGSARAEPASDVSFSFRAITWSDAPLAGLTIPTAGNPLVIDAPVNQRSRAYEYRGDPTVEIYPGKDMTDASPVGQFVAGPNWSQVLLFLLPNPRGGDVKVFAMDDSLSAFPPDTVRFVNLSGKTIAGFLGNQKVVLENMDDKQLSAAGGAAFLPIRFAESSSEQGGWKRFLSSAVGVNKGMRTLIVFYPGSADNQRTGKEICYKLFYDYPATSSSVVAGNTQR